MNWARTASLWSLLALASCATPVKHLDLAWMSPGKTTRSEVRQQLGEPARYLDRNSIMAYRVCEENDKDNHNLGYHGIDVICHDKVGNAGQSLVVRFDPQGRYLQHRLIALKTEK